MVLQGQHGGQLTAGLVHPPCIQQHPHEFEAVGQEARLAGDGLPQVLRGSLPTGPPELILAHQAQHQEAGYRVDPQHPRMQAAHRVVGSPMVRLPVQDPAGLLVDLPGEGDLTLVRLLVDAEPHGGDPPPAGLQVVGVVGQPRVRQQLHLQVDGPADGGGFVAPGVGQEERDVPERPRGAGEAGVIGAAGDRKGPARGGVRPGRDRSRGT